MIDLSLGSVFTTLLGIPLLNNSIFQRRIAAAINKIPLHFLLQLIFKVKFRLLKYFHIYSPASVVIHLSNKVIDNCYVPLIIIIVKTFVITISCNLIINFS